MSAEKSNWKEAIVVHLMMKAGVEAGVSFKQNPATSLLDHDVSIFAFLIPKSWKYVVFLDCISYQYHELFISLQLNKENGDHN